MRALIACLLLLGCAAATDKPAKGPSFDSKTSALLELQRTSPGGVIDLTQKVFDEFVVGRSRPYSLIIVADSRNMRNQGKLQLGTLIAEYGLAARAIAKEHVGKRTAGQVFFTRVEFTASKDLFGRMGIKALPWMARIPPSMPISKDGAVKLKDADLNNDPDYPWAAEAIGSFVEDKTGLKSGAIERSSFLHSSLMPFFTLGFVGMAVLVGYQLYYLPLMRNPTLYLLGALVIWWFSVSGGMFNIIRGVPLVGFDPRAKKAMLFMSGSGQLGAEGFIMGTLYTSFGLAVAGFTALLPRVKDQKTQRVLGYSLLAVMFLSYRFVTANHQWKTGMTTHWYWF